MADYSEPFTKMAATVEKNKTEFSGAFVISVLQEGEVEPIIISAMLTDMRDPEAILSLIGARLHIEINKLADQSPPGFSPR